MFRKKVYILLLILLILPSCKNSTNNINTNQLNNQYFNKINYPDFFDLTIVEEAIYIDDIILVNPKFYLKNYTSSNFIIPLNIDYIKRENEVMLLEEKTYNALYALYNDALNNNIYFTLFSGYRSFEKQTYLYINSNNPLLVSKPGHSEHHTGYAVDLSTRDSGLTYYFEETAAFKYLINNAHKFGFILRYPKNKINITGYNYEPWHFRYVGINHALIIHENNLTLEEYIYNYLIIP